MKSFLIGYMCDSPKFGSAVSSGYNPIKIVKGGSIKQVRKDYASRCGFDINNSNFIVEEVKNE